MTKTEAKKKLKKDLGITAILRLFRFWGNAIRACKRRFGYESELSKILRNGFPRAGGCTINLIAFLHLTIFLAYQVIR